MIQRFRELEQKGIYLRSADKEFGPFVEQRAKEIIETSREEIYRLSNWCGHSVADDSRKSRQALTSSVGRLGITASTLADTSTTAHKSARAQSAYPFDFVESDNFAPTRSLAGHELPRQMLGWFGSHGAIDRSLPVFWFGSPRSFRDTASPRSRLLGPKPRAGKRGQHQSERWRCAARRSQSIDSTQANSKRSSTAGRCPTPLVTLQPACWLPISISTIFEELDIKRSKWKI